MRLSRYFLPLLRDDPKEAEIVSHKLMLRAGLVRQSSAGIYSWLPLGYRVLSKIEQIVREEQDRAGALELLRPRSGAKAAAMRSTARRCCASATAMSARCFTGPPTRS
jgi:prolyl-tRNA synthetase